MGSDRKFVLRLAEDVFCDWARGLRLTHALWAHGVDHLDLDTRAAVMDELDLRLVEGAPRREPESEFVVTTPLSERSGDA